MLQRDTAQPEPARPPAEQDPAARSVPAPRSGAAPAWTAWWNRGAATLPVAVMLFAGYQRRWMSDDGLIYTRTVRQLLAGNGPVFNPGERAEASTSALWQWLIALVSLITRIDPAEAAVFLGVALTGAGYGFALAAARRRHPQGRALMPAGVLVLLALPPTWDFASSGLETGLGTCWMGGAYWLTVRCADRLRRGRGQTAAAAVIGLGPLVRPDFALPALALFAALCVVVRAGRWSVARLTGCAAALPLAYEMFRAAYYGELVPLPAVSKGAASGRVARGLTYLGDFASPYALWVPAVLLAAIAAILFATRPNRRRRRPGAVALTAAPVAAGLGMAGYVVWVGGDFMHARMLLPALFMLLLPVMLVPASLPVVSPLAALCVWVAVCAVSWRVPYETQVIDPRTQISDERAFYTGQARSAHPDTAAAHEAHDPITPGITRMLASRRRVLLLPGGGIVPLRPGAPGTVAFAWPALGINGALTPVGDTAIDPMGLAYPLAAHLEAGPVGRAGHDKWIGDVWIVADYGDPAATVPQGVDPGQLAAARRALSCGALAELQASARAPLTWGRAWSNLVGAFSRADVTVPVDPYAAERKFCGP